MYECVDQSQESVPGNSADTDGALFYHVEVPCGDGLTCPPYNEINELTCVVCTKQECFGSGYIILQKSTIWGNIQITHGDLSTMQTILVASKEGVSLCQ